MMSTAKNKQTKHVSVSQLKKQQKQTAALRVSVMPSEGCHDTNSPTYKQTEDFVMTPQIISCLPTKTDEVSF